MKVEGWESHPAWVVVVQQEGGEFRYGAASRDEAEEIADTLWASSEGAADVTVWRREAHLPSEGGHDDDPTSGRVLP